MSTASTAASSPTTTPLGSSTWSPSSPIVTKRAGVVAGLRESDAPQDRLVADRVAAFDDGNTKANGRG